MRPKGVTINVTEFKAKCLEHLRKLETGKLTRVTVTRRGKPVAVIERAVAREMPVKDVYGFMRDVMRLSPDYDPFEQVVEEPSDPFFDAASDGDAAA